MSALEISNSARLVCSMLERLTDILWLVEMLWRFACLSALALSQLVVACIHPEHL